jgi:fructose-bisphosphate aldolase class 1
MTRLHGEGEQVRSFADRLEETCSDEEVLVEVFHALRLQGVRLEAMILKPNMVLTALRGLVPTSVDKVADRTLTSLLRSAAATLPSVASRATHRF